MVTDGVALSCSGRRTEPGLLRRLPGITALSLPPELLSVGVLEWLLTSELRLALGQSAAGLLRGSVGVALGGALVPGCGTSGPGDWSSEGTPRTPKTPRRAA